MDLVGRVDEIKQLDQAFNDQKIQLVCLWAGGGVGKSALTFKWLQNMQPDYHNVEKVFAWSFYSQGSHNTQNSSLPFFQEVLAFVGCEEEMPKDEYKKGQLLGKYLRKQSVILILDGLEPLQHPLNILDGELKDKALQALFDDLFYYGLAKNSLMLISSRQPLKELEQWDKEKYLEIPLETLDEKTGALILKNLGVIGFEKELEQTTQEIGGHALSLILLGKLLKEKFAGKIERRDQLPKLWTERKLGNHAKNILQYYWDLWTADSPEKALLCLLGLFDRPMGLLEKEVLIQKAAIANPLKYLEDCEWNTLEENLEKMGLLLRDHQDWQSSKDCQSSTISRMEWDCHPLIREFMGEQFKKTYFKLFQQAHLILFEFYQRQPEKHQPDTLEELAPLYRAVVHGCLAGEFQKALDDVYWERIRRGSEHYSTSKLGGYAEDLTALAAFFPQGWSQPVQQGLSPANQAWLLAVASFCLMSLGRLTESVEPRKASLPIFEKQQDWETCSATAQNLVDLFVPLGRLTEAANVAQQAIDYAQQAEDLFQQITSQARLATVLHRVGKLEESKHHFEQAEQLQKERQPNYPQLYSDFGFYYCALLLETTDRAVSLKVLERGEYSLKIGFENNHLITIALDQLTLARVHFKLGSKEKEIEMYFNQAVDGIRKANFILFIPFFLIERANFFLEINELEKAMRDLNEAKQLISRCGMKLYEVDYHLAMCRYYLIKTNSYKTSNPSSHAGAWELENKTSNPSSHAGAWELGSSPASARELESPTASSHARAWELENSRDARAQELENAKLSFDKHLISAKTLIKSTGYHLRDKSVSELETQMNADKNTHKHE